jgi:hypothetical protein
MGGREDGRTDSEWQTFVLPNAREVKRSGACKMVSDREKGTHRMEQTSGSLQPETDIYIPLQLINLYPKIRTASAFHSTQPRALTPPLK